MIMQSIRYRYQMFAARQKAHRDLIVILSSMKPVQRVASEPNLPRQSLSFSWLLQTSVFPQASVVLWHV